MEKFCLLFAVLNFSGSANMGYSFGVPAEGVYTKLLGTTDSRFTSTESEAYPEHVTAVKRECDGLPYTLTVDLPPLSGVVYAVPRYKA